MLKVDLEELKGREESFFLVFVEHEELVFEPHCFCGEVLEEGFFCPVCKRKVEISSFVCKHPTLVSVVEKFTRGHPEFRDFKTYCLKEKL